MKSILVLFVTLFSLNTYATSDAFTSVWLVVQEIQVEDFVLKKVPVIGCYGLSQGPELVQFTAPYKLTDSIGCGTAMTVETDINALSCATVLDSEESEDFSSFKKIVLDISACSEKENKRFITLIRTAAARNFPQTENGKIVPEKEVELILRK